MNYSEGKQSIQYWWSIIIMCFQKGIMAKKITGKLLSADYLWLEKCRVVKWKSRLPKRPNLEFIFFDGFDIFTLATIYKINISVDYNNGYNNSDYKQQYS